MCPSRPAARPSRRVGRHATAQAPAESKPCNRLKRRRARPPAAPVYQHPLSIRTHVEAALCPLTLHLCAATSPLLAPAPPFPAARICCGEVERKELTAHTRLRFAAVATRRDLYPIPHDRLVTDVFADWQDGVSDDPILPDSALSAKFAGGGVNGGIGEGLPVAPPPHIISRREAYRAEQMAIQHRKREAEGASGPLTETVADILLEADMARTGDFSSPRGESVLSREALRAAKEEFAAEEERRQAAIAAKKAAAAAAAEARAAQQAAKEAKAKAKADKAQRKANKLAEARAADAAERAAIDEAERERKKEMEAFRAKMAGVNASSDGAASRAANGAAANGSTTHGSAGARGQTSTSGGSGGATAGAGVVGGVASQTPITEVHKRVRGSNQPDPYQTPCPARSPSHPPHLARLAHVPFWLTLAVVRCPWARASCASSCAPCLSALTLTDPARSLRPR